MQFVADQLESRLAGGDFRCFLVHGPEPLLVEEVRDRIRSHFAALGFDEVDRLTVESGFDWAALDQSSRSLSLFAQRRYIELRLPSGKPGDAGAAFIGRFAAERHVDTALVVLCGRLDSKALGASWCRAVAEHGAVVDTGTVAAAQLPRWIAGRFAELGVDCASGVAARLAYYVEGNLLAADQEIRKLALILPEGATLDEERLEAVMADHARFNVFAFVDACVSGQAGRALRILRSLRQEGSEPVMLVWALAREARSLNLVGAELKAGGARQEVMRRHRIWPSRVPMVMSALKRLGVSRLNRIHARVARLDRLVKGHEREVRGTDDAWIEIERVALAICGINSVI